LQAAVNQALGYSGQGEDKGGNRNASNRIMIALLLNMYLGRYCGTDILVAVLVIFK
jgi:hypothetical protein